MTEKPPIGAKPYYIAADERICELAEAILRYAYKSNSREQKQMKIWAMEIVKQCELLSSIKMMEADQ